MNSIKESIKEKINSWLEAKLNELGAFLVDLKYNPASGRIQVFVESDKGIDIDTCATISRFLEFHLDHDETVNPKYILEVSSPGSDTPFKLKRQYLRHIGSEIEVLLEDGSRKEGVLKEVSEDNIKLEELLPKKGKNKALPRESKVVEIPFTALREAKRKIIFK